MLCIGYNIVLLQILFKGIFISLVKKFGHINMCRNMLQVPIKPGLIAIIEKVKKGKYS